MRVSFLLWLHYPQLVISLVTISSTFYFSGYIILNIFFILYATIFSKFYFTLATMYSTFLFIRLQYPQHFFTGYNILNFLFSLATISSTFYSLWLQYPQHFLSSNNISIFFSGYSIINIFIWLQYHQHLLSGYSIMNIFYLGKISKAIFFSGSTFSRPQAAPSFHYSLSAIGADNEEQGTNNCSDRDLICLPRHLRDSLITASLFCFLESTAVYVLRISLPVNVVG